MLTTSGLSDEPRVDFESVKREVSKALNLPAGEWEDYGVSGGSYLLLLDGRIQFRIQHIWDDEVDEETGGVLSKTYNTSFITISEYPKYVSINIGDRRDDWVSFSREAAEAYRSLYKF